MKGVILYYSGSGNTKLACQYISRNLTNIEIELFNMVKAEKIPDFDPFDIVGFATFTDFGDPPFLVQNFIEKIPQQEEKLAFVFNTYGYTSWRTILTLAKWVEKRGFNVVTGYSLHTPESYPPMIIRGRGAELNPDEKEMAKFNEFIKDLDEIIDTHKLGKTIKKRKLRTGMLGKSLPAFSRKKARKSMGEKFVDEDLCDLCGVCQKGCPYNAITIDSKPRFDMDSCYGCWWCFNHCPSKAIYTKKVRGVGYYPKPNDHIRKILKS